MLQLTPQMRIYLAVQPVDFRKGIDGIAHVCRRTLDVDPFSGGVFVFRNRKRTALKILVYDGQGFWLYVVLILMLSSMWNVFYILDSA